MAGLPASVRYALSVSVLITVAAAGIFAQNATPSRLPMDVRGAAQLLAFTGRVVVQRQSPWRLDIGEYVYPLEVISTGSDGSAMFKVADGSTFEVFPNSRVVFRANPGNWEDLLEIMLGKIRVQIEHFGGAPNNNKVFTPTAVISVRGTIFDVEYDADVNVTTVLDEEGSVEVARALRRNDTRILNPGEKITVYKNDSLARSFDTGGVMKRIFQSAMDALTQQIVNARSTPTVAGAPGAVSTGGGTSAGDKNNTPPPPPPPPPPAVP